MEFDDTARLQSGAGAQCEQRADRRGGRSERTDDWRRLRRTGWVESDGRALAVRVDHPFGPTAGALVVVPPVGREAVVAIRTTTALALTAARAGFVAFSYSPSGEGDSSDLQPRDDPGEAWAADLRAVVAAARAHVGPDAPVHVVGMRVGACLLDGLPDGPGEHIAWEPVSGRGFLRAHSIIRRDSVPVPVVPHGVEVEGAWFTPEQAAGLMTLRAPRRGENVVMEKERRAALRIALGAPFFAHVPVESIERIVAGLPCGVERPTHLWEGPRSATVARTDGVRIVEHCTTIGTLPAVVTTAEGVRPRRGATFTAMGSELKCGPGRAWVEASRRLAPLGVVGVRADRRFIGDDTGPDQCVEPRPYTDGNVEDVTAAAEHLRDQGLPVVGVGACAGAWALLRAARGGVFDEVVAVNPVHWNPHSSVYDEAFYTHYHGGDETGSDVADGEQAARGEQRRAGLRQAVIRRIESVRPGVGARLGVHLETVSHEFAIRFPRLRWALRRDVPLDLTSMLIGPLRAPTRVTILLGTEEHRIFVGKGGRRSVSSAARRGVGVLVRHDPRVDHSVFSRAGKEATVSLLLERLGGRPVSPTAHEHATSTAPHRDSATVGARVSGTMSVTTGERRPA